MVLPNVYKTIYKIMVVVFFLRNYVFDYLLIFDWLYHHPSTCVIFFYVLSFGHYHGGVVDTQHLLLVC